MTDTNTQARTIALTPEWQKELLLEHLDPQTAQIINNHDDWLMLVKDDHVSISFDCPSPGIAWDLYNRRDRLSAAIIESTGLPLQASFCYCARKPYNCSCWESPCLVLRTA